MYLPGWLHATLLDRARAEPKREVCGLVGARRGEPVSHYPIPNVAPEPAARFSMDPAAQIDAMRRMRDAGEALFAIYHSHPHGPPRPSAIDLEEAAYPETLYLIVGLRPEPELCGYFLDGGKVTPVALRIGT